MICLKKETMAREGWMHLFVLGILLTFVTGQRTPVQVRLRGGLNDREGRVEVLYQGVWGTICDDAWDAKDTGVVCRMLGFVGASRPHNGSYFPPGNSRMPIHLDDVNCDGDEANIEDCTHSGWDSSNCQHNEDAGVTCLGERVSTTTTTTRRPTTTTAPPTICENPSTDVRLVGDENSNPWEGRVQVFYQGNWYEVCDDMWGRADAQVVCKMLCYNPANARAHIGTTYGNITEDILLDNVRCAGNEDSIFDCPANTYRDHDCSYNEGAGVSCIPDNPNPPPPPDPEIVCENEQITARFLRDDDERLRPEHLTLSGRDGCGYTTGISATHVSISVPFIGCGTTRQINETDIIYDNNVRYEIPPDADVITRRQIFHIAVYCVMGRNDDPENAVEPEEATIAPQFGNGHFEVGMFIYRSNRFEEPISQFPAQVKLGNMVFVALTLTTTDNQLKIVVPRCYTTPTEDPDSEPKYFLIQDKCKVDSSVEFYPINQTMFAYRFRSFKFQGSSDIVYLHCKAYVCGENEKDARCDRSCASGSSSGSAGKRHRRKRDVTSGSDTPALEDYEIIFPNHTIFHMEKGPLFFLDESDIQSTMLSSSTLAASPNSSITTTISQSPEGCSSVSVISSTPKAVLADVPDDGQPKESFSKKTKDVGSSALPSRCSHVTWVVLILFLVQNVINAIL